MFEECAVLPIEMQPGYLVTGKVPKTHTHIMLIILICTILIIYMASCIYIYIYVHIFSFSVIHEAMNNIIVSKHIT